MLPKEQLPAGFVFRAQEKGWVTLKWKNLCLIGLKFFWGRRPGVFLGQRVLLIHDAFHGYATEKIKKLL